MKATLHMDGRPPIFDDNGAPEPLPDYFGYDFWVNSQLSVARFFGGCEFNGTKYVVDMDTGDLVKFSYLKEYLKKHYSSVTSRYAGKKLTYNAEIAGEWSDGDEGYEILFAEYMDRVPDADIPLRFAEVRMTVFSENSKAFEITAYAVQAGGSWYYWKTD